MFLLLPEFPPVTGRRVWLFLYYCKKQKDIWSVDIMSASNKMRNYVWNDRIMRSSLWIAILVFIIEVLIAISYELTGNIEDILTYGFSNVIIPTIINSVILAIGYLIERSKKLSSNLSRDFPMITMTAICFVVAFFHFEVASAPYIFILPVLLSSGLGESKYTLRIYIVEFVLLLGIIFYKMFSLGTITIEMDFIIHSFSAIVLLAVTFFVANALIDREKKKIDEIRLMQISKQALEEKLIYDSLTHIFNPGGFYNILEREISNSIKYNSSLSLVVMDIDDFKLINDTYGHEKGNIILSKFAYELKLLVDGKGYACRFGGDEFTLILPQMNAQQTYEMAKLFFENLKMYRFPEINGNTITLSVAVGEYQGECNTHDFFEKVDRAMYLIKNNGKNNVTICRDSVSI